MTRTNELTEVGREYAAVYAAHYTGRRLPEALQLYIYMKLIASHSSAKEAGYSWMQAPNIINASVSEQELLDAQVELAVGHFGH